MSLCAIIPIKAFREGKSRLSNVLSEEKREGLNQYLLKSTLLCLQKVNEIEHCLVISCDGSALEVAKAFGAMTVQEVYNTNINRSLHTAAIAAKGFGFSKVLILPADLPLLTEIDIINVINQSGCPPEIVIVPDRKLYGTNALLLNPINVINYNFGEQSFKKHIRQARNKNVNIKIYKSDNLSFDLDLPEDWEILKDRMQQEMILNNSNNQEVRT